MRNVWVRIDDIYSSLLGTKRKHMMGIARRRWDKNTSEKFLSSDSKHNQATTKQLRKELPLGGLWYFYWKLIAELSVLLSKRTVTSWALTGCLLKKLFSAYHLEFRRFHCWCREQGGLATSTVWFIMNIYNAYEFIKQKFEALSIILSLRL